MKAVTYNIQYSRGKDGRYDLARIGREVAGADLIALQEVERHRPRSALRDQPAELGESLGAYYWVYGPSFDMDASATAVDGKVTNRRRQLAFLLAAQDRAVAKQGAWSRPGDIRGDDWSAGAVSQGAFAAWWLWPNVTFNTFPGDGNITVLHIMPTGPETVYEHFDFYFLKDTPSEQEMQAIKYIDDVLQPEEIGLVESVQRGLASRD